MSVPFPAFAWKVFCEFCSLLLRRPFWSPIQLLLRVEQCLTSVMPVSCPTSLVAFFPSEVYRNVGACDVLPRIVESLGRNKLSTVQFLRNGAVRLTFVDTPSCDVVALDGFTFNDHSIRVQAVEQRSRIVYLRDLPCEVPDDAVRSALRPFGEVHSLKQSRQDGFPGLFDGSWTVKMSLAKDIPPVLLVAGFECRIWYRRQPQNCPICRAPGHQVMECPFNGVCRRCRQPGHVARDCRRAWGVPVSRPGHRRAPASQPSAPSATSPPPPPPPPPPGPSPSGHVQVLAVDEEESDMDFQPAPVEDVVESSGDMFSGDEEVIAAAAAVVVDSPSPRRSCRRRHSRRNRAAVPFPPPGTVGHHRPADLLSLDMDLSVEEDHAGVSYLSSFKEIWADALTWEELRSVKRGFVLRRYRT